MVLCISCCVCCHGSVLESRPESVKDLGGQKLGVVLLPSTIDADSDTGKDRTAASFLDTSASSAHAANVSLRDRPAISSCSTRTQSVTLQVWVKRVGQHGVCIIASPVMC